jgi:hypothetical protein
MTEAEWLACEDPQPILEFLRGRASEQKLRLLACGCCYHVYIGYEDGDEWAAVEVSERYADGFATAHELSQAREGMDWGDYRDSPADHASSPDLERVAGGAAAAASLIRNNLSLADPDRSYQEELTAQVSFLRDIFGNPFRPVAFPPAWRTEAAVLLAAQMYEWRNFSDMPILADRLQDGGCDNDDILDHCRGPGPHVRGCWVVDLVLGKE